MTQHGARLARPQHVTVIDAVRPERHRGDQRHDLAARVRRAGPITEIDHPVNEALNPQPIGEHRRQHHARVGDRPLIVEHDPRCVRQTVHHAGDPLAQDPQPLARPVLPASGGYLNLGPGRLIAAERWIEAKRAVRAGPGLSALDLLLRPAPDVFRLVIVTQLVIVIIVFRCAVRPLDLVPLDPSRHHVDHEHKGDAASDKHPGAPTSPSTARPISTGSPPSSTTDPANA